MTRARGVGGVTALPDGRFWARLTVEGKRESLGIYPTREEAEGVLKGAANRKASAGFLNPAHIFATYGEKALDTREREGFRGTDKDRDVWRAHLLPSILADRPVKEITTREIGRVVKTLRKKTRKQGDKALARSTVQKALTVLSGIFAQAIEDEIRPDNPCFGVKVKKNKVEELDPDLDPKWDYLRPEEQHALATCPAIPLDGRLMVRIAMGTGLRQGEQWNLELRDVFASEDETDPRIFVRYGSRGKVPKNGQTRTVQLFGDALVAMRAWLAHLPLYAPENPHGLAFPTPTGCRRQPKAPCRQERVPVAIAGKGVRKTRVRYLLPEWLALAGISRKLRWHDLRHTCASSLVSGFWGRKWSLDEVRDLMGHSSVQVTEIYAHLDRDAQRQAARATCGVMARVTGSGGGGGSVAAIFNDFTGAEDRARTDDRRFTKEGLSVVPAGVSTPIYLNTTPLAPLAEAIMRMAASGDGTRLAMVATALASAILDDVPAPPAKGKVTA